MRTVPNDGWMMFCDVAWVENNHSMMRAAAEQYTGHMIDITILWADSIT